jgi:hypothetical protein
MFLQRQSVLIFLSLALFTLIGGCQPTAPISQAVAAQGVEQSGPTIEEVTFIAADYRYSGPETIPGGWTNLRLLNQGNDAHHIQLLKLDDNKEIADLTAALQADLRWPEWTQAYGGPNAVFPGASSNALVYLDPGNYALLSWVPDPAGAPQFLRGMIKALTVTASETATVVEPAAEISLELVDFSFILSQTPGPGIQTIRVSNQGSQPHEVLLVKLPAEATAMDFIMSIGTEALQGELAGGVTEIEPGKQNSFTANFEAGVKYGLICFVTNHANDKLHFMEGMIQEFVVE